MSYARPLFSSGGGGGGPPGPTGPQGPPVPANSSSLGELNIISHTTPLNLPEQNTFYQITGWNIGMNCGETAGQTVFHCHVHLIPRRVADTSNPSGGIRNLLNIHSSS